MDEMKEDVVICRCEDIKKSQILRAIEDGARTIDEIKRSTRTGMGLCQGLICGRLVAQIISQKLGLDPSLIIPSTPRPPVRPINLSTLLGRKDTPSG